MFCAATSNTRAALRRSQESSPGRLRPSVSLRGCRHFVSALCSFGAFSPPRDIQHARAVQDQVLPVTNSCRQSALLTQLLHQEPRESSRTLARPSLHRTLHRCIGNHGMGLGVAAAPRGHEIECRLVGFARSLGDDRFKGAQGLSSRFASECRSITRSHRQVLSGQHVRGRRSPQDVIQVSITHDRNQFGRCSIPSEGARHVVLATVHPTRALVPGRGDSGRAGVHGPVLYLVEVTLVTQVCTDPFASRQSTVVPRFLPLIGFIRITETLRKN